ncbi:MAG: hypothetical protein GX321_01565 [Clostridiales bacterium]|nr:hypothetical protein [Clostridiales bacterium]
MGRISILLLILIININFFINIYPKYSDEIWTTNGNANLTPMEALDMVREEYATNFIKSSFKENEEEYYYKLALADYYLVYEGIEEISGCYLIHLYEFVLDDEETGIGHTVTYGWYRVNPFTGEIEVYSDF